MSEEIMIQLVGSLKYLAAGIALIALGGVGNGLGRIFSSLVSEVSRNPGATKTLFTYALIGLALTEAIALYVLVLVFIMMFS